MQKSLIERIEDEKVDNGKGVKFTPAAKTALKMLAAQFDATLSEAVGIARMVLKDTTQLEAINLVDEKNKNIIAGWIKKLIDKYDVEKEVLNKIYEE